MPEHPRGTRLTYDQLARYWDALDQDASREPVSLDPELAATIRRFHEIAARNPGRGPDPLFVNRLLEQLASSAALNQAAPRSLPTEHVASPNGRTLGSASGSVLDLPSRRRGLTLAQFATAALVLLTLVASFFVFGPSRLHQQGDRPVFIPAISGTPATPDAVEQPVAELVWSLDGGPALPFHDPTALAFDPAGNLWVPDAGNDRFQIFTPDGEFLQSWGESGSENGQLFLSVGGYGYGAVAWDTDGNYYVADTGNFRIQKFAPDRSFVTAWGNRGEGDGQFISLTDLTVDQDGRILAVDEQRNDIQVFDRDGRFLTAWPVSGFGESPLDGPYSLDIATNGDVYVSEYGGNRVQSFSPTGAPLLTFGGNAGNEQLSSPAGITLDEQGLLIVADYGNHRIQVFTTEGSSVGAFGEMGFDEGQFVNPIFAALDGRGFIYVSDEGSDRVQKFRLLPPLAPP
jgi:DNA-binding beta-propeller fold protein YncE